MRRFFNRLGMMFQAMVAWFLPVYQQAGAVQAKGPRRTVSWVLHALIVAAIVVGLFLLGGALHLERYIPKKYPLLRRSWLSILFLLLYLLGWMVLLLVKALRAEDDEGRFPDIDSAWDEGVATLAAAGVRLADLPIFLVLGQPEGDERQLFQAAQVQLVVPQAPAGADPPVHVYATREAVYVTCAGASVLGAHVAVLAGKVALAEAVAPGAPPLVGEDEDDDPLKRTLDPGRLGGPVADIQQIRARADRERRPMNEFEARQIRSLHRRDDPRGSLPNHPERVERERARLAYLCRLIARDRHPYCPVNGVLVLLPFAGTDHIQDATDTGNLMRLDLETARAALRVRCPVFALVCDFQVIPGFAEFLERFSAQDRKQRVGHRCPLVPDFTQGGFGRDDPMGGMVDSLAGWICNAVVPGWVYRKFQVEKESDANSVKAAVRHNAQLYLFANELRERRNRLGTILKHGLAAEGAERPLFGGCYVAGTGKDANREQAFVTGVLRRLVEEQNRVYWTAEALGEEQRLQRWTGLGWAALGGAGALALLVWLFTHWG